MESANDINSAWMTAGILTISDSVSRGTREDKGGDGAVSWLESHHFRIARRSSVADECTLIQNALTEWTDEGISLIVTTGGTGLGPRDVTPQCTQSVCDYLVPGLAEAMRAGSLQSTPFAIISRQIAGVRKQTLIVNLPGSPRGVIECLDIIAPVLPHAVQLLHGDTAHREG